MLKYTYLLVVPVVLTIAGSAGAVTSAELYRPSPETFGKFEARIQFAGGDGVVSSFFLWKAGSEQSSVYWNELDFEKLGAACELQTNTIYGLPQSNHEEGDYTLDGLCDGYHTYAYEWTPESIAWLVDGIEIRRDTGVGAAAYADNATEGMQFRFNIWPGNASFGGNFSEASLPVYQFVAWAQYSDYTPGAGEDGSDFTLSWREEFDALPRGWLMGSWTSPLNGSTHSSRNVAFVDGIAVLALTADDAAGYSGSPPPDTGGTVDVPSSGGAGGSAGAATGGTDLSPANSPFTDEGGGEGCGCRLARSQSRGLGGVAVLAGAAFGWWRRRRRSGGRVG
jgi:endo-1,3-1,4-beta-glycanase ExoK